MMDNKSRLGEAVAAIEQQRGPLLAYWSARPDIQEFFGRAAISGDEARKAYLSEILGCVVGVLKGHIAIGDCGGISKLLYALRDKPIRTLDLMLLFTGLFDAVEAVLYEEGIASRRLREALLEQRNELLNGIYDNYAVAFADTAAESERQLGLLNEYKRAVDLSNIVSKTNPKGIITYVNDQFCQISGFSREELIGRPHNIVRHPDMLSESFEELWVTIRQKLVWRGIVKNLKKDGGYYIVNTTVVPILDLSGDIVEYISIRHDVTELEQAKEKLEAINNAMKIKVSELYDMTLNLEQQATTDSLTGIYNRLKFNEALELEVARARQSSAPLSLIFFDLDQFKSINDTYGHQIGDAVLREVVGIVLKNIKHSDIFARWGGEEFAILAGGTDCNGAALLAEKLRERIAAFSFHHNLKVTSSFGVATLSGDSADGLVARADQALYAAKENGRNRVERSEAVLCE